MAEDNIHIEILGESPGNKPKIEKSGDIIKITKQGLRGQNKGKAMKS